ncbi:MAG: LysE family transporter [Chloroflexi bacterium]|nr:LysE family transporter [Chloroflexota bacterium]
MPDLSAPLLLFGTSFAVGLSGAVSPGPLLTIVISQSARRGFWAGPLIVAGHTGLELGVVIALAAGLSQILRQGGVVGAIGLVGGVILLWMAWGLLRSARQATALLPAQPAYGGRSRSTALGLVGMGVLVSLSNPFWALWWVSVGGALLVQALESAVVGVASFYLGHILADLVWYSGVSALVGGGRRYLSVPLYRGVLLACAVFLAFLGLYFLGTGILVFSV